MAFYITNEPNDKDLVKQLTIATPFELRCGDVNFTGRWVDGEEIWIWGERKKLGDLVACILDTGRLLRQIQEAHQSGFKFLFLIIETTFLRANPKSGVLEIRTGKGWKEYKLGSMSKPIQYSRIMGYLNQLRYYLGVHIYYTNSVRETAQVIMGVYSMFQTTPEEHDSLQQFVTTPAPIESFLQKPSLIRRMAKELPGIGWDRSKDIEAELVTARQLCRVLGDGSRAELLNIEGIGKKTVDSIMEALEDNG